MNLLDLCDDLLGMIGENVLSIKRKEDDERRKVFDEVLQDIRDDYICEEGFWWWGKDDKRHPPYNKMIHERYKAKHKFYQDWFYNFLEQYERDEIRGVIQEIKKCEINLYDKYLYDIDTLGEIWRDDTFPCLDLEQKEWFYDRYWKMCWFHYRITL